MLIMEGDKALIETRAPTINKSVGSHVAAKGN